MSNPEKGHRSTEALVACSNVDETPVSLSFFLVAFGPWRFFGSRPAKIGRASNAEEETQAGNFAEIHTSIP